MANRWWIYQRERFPLAGHGVLVAAISLSAVGFSALLRGEAALPQPWQLVVAFVTVLLFFLQLRIFDEHKDYDEDARFRPYRAVPRGLVRLRELAAVVVAAGVVQLGLALALDARLVPLILLVWTTMALMGREFFVGDWLRARPVAYLASHMMILVWIGLYASACDWLVAGAAPPDGLVWFLAVAYGNGVVFEIGRKIRSPADEEPGVATYSALWGRRSAVAAWLAAQLGAAAFALAAAERIGFVVPTAGVIAALLALGAAVGVGFMRRPAFGTGKAFERLSALWILALSLALGPAPLLLRA